MAEITISSLQEMENFAEQMAKTMPEGTVVFLKGEMGTGKTTFVQAFAKALGISDPVRSPTFIIQNEYIFGENKKLNHIDLYRLETMPELNELNLEKLRNPYSYTFIEWADKFEDSLTNLFKNSPIYRFEFETTGENERHIKYENSSN